MTGELGLLEKLRRGDPAGATELVERYAARAYRVALVITRDAEDAEKVVGDAVCNVIRNVETVRGDAALGPWLFRLVTNAACQKARRTTAQRAEISLEDVLPRFHDDGEPTALVDDWSGRLNDPVALSRVRTTLNAAIDELSPENRAVVVLRDVEGLTVAEAAASMGTTVANTKTRLHRARLFLRQRLAARMEMAS
jgi:RNA polymerase sigma-70 factor (ECF subfamily)